MTDHSRPGFHDDELFSILRTAAEAAPEKAALTYDGRDVTYAELLSAAEILASRLAATGIGAGDIVGLIAANTPDYLLMFFATARIAAVIVPVPRGSSSEEVMALTGETDVTAICSSGSADPPVAGAAGAFVPAWSGEAIRVRRLENAGEATRRERLLAAQVRMIRFSSGTTGKAKGVMLSADAILARAATFSGAYSLSESSCLLHLLSAELATPTLLGCMARRATIVFEEVHRLNSIAELVPKHGITHVHAAPLFYRMMVGGRFGGEALQNVKAFISTGAPLALDVAASFREKYGREILQYYALAECGTVFACNTEAIEKRGSSGVVLPGCEVKLVNSESPAPVGDVAVRGAGLFEGYYRPWRLRSEVLDNGWFMTGDVARRDDEGYYWIVGRTKNVINVAGVKVFPGEIEQVLLGHPLVEEAAVFGAADARFGEVAHAKVVLAAGSACSEKELIQFCNRKVSLFKRLRSIEIVEELPRTATGKLKRTFSD